MNSSSPAIPYQNCLYPLARPETRCGVERRVAELLDAKEITNASLQQYLNQSAKSVVVRVGIDCRISTAVPKTTLAKNQQDLIPAKQD